MKELIVLSGKGGTGKTSTLGAFASLAENKIIVDADVDAADLHLILKPEEKEAHLFQGGAMARINPDLCTGCGECMNRCRFDAVRPDFTIDTIACESCSVCAHFCPESAIEMVPRTCGDWFVSETPYGTMVHARLGIAEENSGLLVSLLRREARERAQAAGKELIIVDGPPGIGCPVIASLTGADALLIVTEPTPTGLHDMKRVKALADFMNVPAMLCINKSDLYPEGADAMAAYADDIGMPIAGRIPYDSNVTAAMVAGTNLVEWGKGPAASAVRSVWTAVTRQMEIWGSPKTGIRPGMRPTL